VEAEMEEDQRDAVTYLHTHSGDITVLCGGRTVAVGELRYTEGLGEVWQRPWEVDGWQFYLDEIKAVDLTKRTITLH
jgi:hypothetical protein